MLKAFATDWSDPSQHTGSVEGKGDLSTKTLDWDSEIVRLIPGSFTGFLCDLEHVTSFLCASVPCL